MTGVCLIIKKIILNKITVRFFKKKKRGSGLMAFLNYYTFKKNCISIFNNLKGVTIHT